MTTSTVLVASEPIMAVKLRTSPSGSNAGPITRIPRHAILRMLGTSAIPSMVDLEWQGERYAAFAADIEERCQVDENDRPAGVRRFLAS